MRLRINEQEYAAKDIEEKLLSMALRTSVPASEALSNTAKLIAFLASDDINYKSTGDYMFRSTVEDLVASIMTNDSRSIMAHHQQLTGLLADATNINPKLH